MEENAQPYILDETDDFAVVFKPCKMHSVPLSQKAGGDKADITLLEWYAQHYPPVFEPQPNVQREGSPLDIMHRLDFETHGLVLFAKNSKAYDFFKSAQDRGEFVKEYSAVCTSAVFNSQSAISPSSGFPPPPRFANSDPSPEKPLIVMSYFRPYGPGRKLVRPATADVKHKEIAKDNCGNNRGGFYRTEIVGINGNVFTARIKRGFRHQIRCHLCWIGCPILNDPLYNEQLTMNNEQGMLALRAHGLFFSDPSSGEQRVFRIAALG